MNNAKTFDTKSFDYITLRLASPERMREWSYGEITKPETINYRTGRSERGGLFDEKIFGPEKDYECYCGKYRRIRYKDIVCEKCGVEVTRAIVRRERMGHIELASPVAHIWFLKGVPSRMALIMGISGSDLEKVIYFAGYIVTVVHEDAKEEVRKSLESEYKSKIKTVTDEDSKEKLKELFTQAKNDIDSIELGRVMNELQYHHFSLKYGSCFEASIGAEAIYALFKNIDLEKLKDQVEKQLEKAKSLEREKLEKRITLIRSLLHSHSRPEWMFLSVIPVIPPALRPMVALDGGRHATSDINDLYRRVINRNNRLRKLIEISAPDVILRNEKRILQEAVDALIDNSMAKQDGAQAMSQSQKRALKSLADNLKSKQGLFRANLLGKRVDYSGRSVIVVGPDLSLSQCGLPKHMALELFRPFVIAKLIETELAYNIRGANKLIEDQIPEVWAILEDVIKGKYVLLNRAPTLHRLGIQAFMPVLIEGNAIQLHPLVCTGFNADFDGDQMAVYVPLSEAAQEEAKNLMAATKNLLKPQNGEPITEPKMDMVLGSFWMTKEVAGEKGEGMIFSSPNQAIMALDFGHITYRAKIKVLPTDKEKYAGFDGQIFETTVGRILFNNILPDTFQFINQEMNKKRIGALVDDLVFHYGIDVTAGFLDKIKAFGFRYATKSGTTWGIDNVRVPEEKKSIVAEARTKERVVINHFEEGLLSEDERYRKVLEIWEKAKKEIEKAIPQTLDTKGSTYDLIISGARGNMGSMVQMCGMKGLIVNTTGRIIDYPVVPSYIEGLSPIQYFITTHGSRKGSADTALNTAKAGYLTRRLVDVSQDVVVTEEDCKTKEYKNVRTEIIGGTEIPLLRQIRGRVLAQDVKSTNTTYKRNTLVTKDIAEDIVKSGATEVAVRSPLFCKGRFGVCQMCYGTDLGRNAIIERGQAVGIIAAQAIGEPGTQLTLRTFHAGGVAGTDITQGLPRVEEIFERRIPKSPAIVAKVDGEVLEVKQNGTDKIIVVLSAEKGASKNASIEYAIPVRRNPIVKAGQKVVAGELLTDGSADISEIFKTGGARMAQEYIVREITKVYELQSASIDHKHIEIIIRQMFSRVRVKESGDSTLSPGEIVERAELDEENMRLEYENLKISRGEQLVLGITEVSLTAKSWLSAASFQNTNRVLINNAVKGGIDRLRGLKENVIVGRLIPAGTGFREISDEIIIDEETGEVL
jgi:DNA-directed RNA polymerase subunit beta'